MPYWVLPPSGILISCDTLQHLTDIKQQTENWKQRMKIFDDDLDSKLQA